MEGFLDQVSGWQLAGWQAYYELEPFGEKRADLRNGTLLTALDRFFQGDKSEARPEQFVLDLTQKKKRPKKRQTSRDHLETFASIMDLYAAQQR